MKHAKAFLPVFFLFLIITLLILFFFQSPLLKPIQAMTVPLQSWLFTTVITPAQPQTPQEKLQQENNELRQQVSKMQELEKENRALRDQFDLSDQSPQNLQAATVIGTKEHVLIINKGAEDGLQKDDVVVVKDNLIGHVSKVTPHIALVDLLTHPSTSFTARIVKNDTIGVVKAEGGTLILDNVVLADELSEKDIVVTKGDIDEKGNGYPPDLTIGKITSVNKKESDLFQTAKIESVVDFAKLRTVFVIVE